jgi:pyruvate/2-oxoglutarate dehydrogenase complex dihydrolipoamide dehydrogenase (E3) component
MKLTSKPTQRHDAIIIGTGQAGPALAQRLVDSGRTVAVIERKFFGGTCVNTGCTPTKTLVASAYAAHMARRAADFGVNIPCEIIVDMKAVKARKDHVSARSRDGIEQWLKNLKGCTVYEGHARFVGPHSVEVAGKVLEAKWIFINVGGRALSPPIPGLDKVSYFTNSTIMDVDFLPPHLIVLGGSYIGLEFAQIYRRFGSEVSVIELAPHLIAREDEDVSLAITDILRSEGIGIHVNSKVTRVGRKGNDIAVEVLRGGIASQISGSHLLSAIGRRPNTDDLGLENAGVAMDDRGFIKVDDELRTNVVGIWALGDCNGRGAFTHTSYNDFEIVAADILDSQQRRVSDRIPAYALYTDPPLGRVGMTEAEVRRTGRPAMIGTIKMERVSRAFERSETHGFMKILVDKASKKILGASFLGLSCDEVVHSILDLMYANVPYTVLQEAVHIHPTVSEYIPVMIGNLKDLQ